MASKVTHSCDRCKKEMRPQGDHLVWKWLLKFHYLPFRVLMDGGRNGRKFDLCKECGGMLWDWLTKRPLYPGDETGRTELE